MRTADPRPAGAVLKCNRDGGRERRSVAELRSSPRRARRAVRRAAARAAARARPLHSPSAGVSTWTELLEDALLSVGGDADARCRRRERDSRRSVIGTTRRPHLAALRELERVRDEVAQDLRDLASSVCSVGTSAGSSKTSATGRFTSSGRSMPRSAPKSSPTSNSAGRTIVLPASTFARSSSR